ncbi:MAG: pyridoxal phosphate-dependent aminotransferase, partial [Chitinophagia bacterium]|nr:pyridoxal phosphate-dependent aminotransferase [Chitinophagia bacterium]
MKSNKIWLSSPHMGGSEKKYVAEAFASNWIAPLGANVTEFENDISQYISREVSFQSAALISGTAAIHLALRILDIQRNDYVLVQSFTFCGTSNPVYYEGAQIVFIDSEPDTWNMCPVALEKAILSLNGNPIRAIMPVHLYGMPAKMDEINAVAVKYGIPVIEDAAEALGSKYKNKSCGTFGDMAALSFNGNKIITTSGGGALASSNAAYIEQARFLATQARDEAPHYQHSQIGYNYRMSNVVAGIGRGQMEVLDLRVQQRRANNLRYRKYFEGIDGIRFQTEPSELYFSNYWLTCILINPEETGGIDREQVRLILQKNDIDSRPLWKPMHMQPVHSDAKFFGEGICEKLFEQGLCLPSGSNL